MSDSSASVVVPTEEAIPTIRRYHLLLGRGVDREPFEECVAASGAVRASAGWLGIAESATQVSPVEADARLARWSRRTGRLAVRITRTDAERFWVAVHYQGRRAFAMIHSEAAHLMGVLAADRRIPVVIDTPFGSDPLILDRVARGEAPALVVEQTIAIRATQLADALSQDDLEVEHYLLRRILAERSEGALYGLLEALRATPLIGCISDLHRRVGKFGYGAEMNGVIGKALFLGLLFPAAVATTVFVLLAERLATAGVSPALSFLGAAAAALLGLWGAREGGRRLAGLGVGPRRALVWAAPPGTSTGGRIRPNPAMRERWGGLFFLLRDIGFLGKLERPAGPAAVYVDTWGIGPDALVESLNRMVEHGHEPPALFDVAARLVTLRDRLIDEHLAGQTPDGPRVAAEVHELLATVIGAAAGAPR